jgi:hypothetical protein
MPTKGPKSPAAPPASGLEALASREPAGGVAASGPWLIFRYLPTSLFSLKMSSATSTVGRTLLSPTPYAVKMAFIDAAFRIGWKGDVGSLVADFAKADLRVGMPMRATVTHTIIKVRQEPKDRKAGQAYGPAVAYREFVHYAGTLEFAFDMATLSAEAAEAITAIGPAIDYIGKRGSFIQYLGVERVQNLASNFTQPIESMSLVAPGRMHISTLDDFGPEANLDALNSYSATAIKRGRHRKFVQTIVPLGVVNVGPGFSEYSR